VELCIDAVGEMQKEFYANYPQHAREEEYKFVAPSSLKPTQACTLHATSAPALFAPRHISDHDHRADKAFWELVMQRGDSGCFDQ
jgi:hypothetical protein